MRPVISPSRIQELQHIIRMEVLSLPDVRVSTRGFRLAERIFVRMTVDARRVFLELKLPHDEAARAVSTLPFVGPMSFGGMGRHGWVEISLTRKSQIRPVLRLVRMSHLLHSATRRTLQPGGAKHKRQTARKPCRPTTDRRR